MTSCLKRTRTAIALFKAVVSRTLFALHGFICIWRVTVIKGQPLYWLLTGTIPVMVLEAVFTIKKKKGGEWKWVCPSVLLYLGTAVPAIWFLELDLMRLRMDAQVSQVSQVSAAVSVAPLGPSVQEDAISSVLNGQLHLSFSLGREEWCKILEQMLLLLLIVGRWLLPKGDITREQLSQLLLVYIGMAADIIELFEAFKEEAVRQNYMLTLIILALWTASLTQFTFVLTATKAKRSRPSFHRTGSFVSAGAVGSKPCCCQTEVLSIVISMTLQDGPFLVLRLLLILRYEVLSYTNIFFTSKNTLVLLLQLYRLFVLFCQKAPRDEDLVIKNQASEEAERGRDKPPSPPPRSAALPRNKALKKTDFATVRFSSDDGDDDDKREDELAATTAGDDDRANAANMRVLWPPVGKSTGAVKNNASRRGSLKRQERELAESPRSSFDSQTPGSKDSIGTTPPHDPHPAATDAEAHATKRHKQKAGRTKVSEDSTRGSMSDSREEDARQGREGGAGKPGLVSRQRSAREQWQDVKILAKSIAFLSEAGKYKTLVLKPVTTTSQHVVYVLQSEGGDDATTSCG
ncbi:hypothetical protein ACOMHN_049073 [Nucella lapillus]